MFLESNWLRSNIKLTIVDTNKNWRSVSSCPHLIWAIFIHYYNSPLWIFWCLLHDVFCSFYCFISWTSLCPKLSNQLGCHLTISLTSKMNSFQIFFFNLCMATNYTIMNYIDVLCLIKMRMGISLNFLPTCCPSSMPNTDVRLYDLFWDLLYKSVNAIEFLLGFLSSFNHINFDIVTYSTKCYNSCTVISSVFKKLNSLGQLRGNILFFLRKNTNDSTALCLLFLSKVKAS